MNPDPFEQHLTAWLSHEAPSTMPGRVLTATFERTSAARQVRSLPRWMLLDANPWLVRLGMSTAVIATVVVIGGVIVIGPPDPQRAGGAAGPVGSCPSAESSPPETVPLGLALVCLDGSGLVDLGLPRDATNVDMTADGSAVTFLTSDVHAGFCGQCVNAPYQAIVATGDTVGDFVYLPGYQDGDGSAITVSSSLMTAWAPDGGSIAYRDAAGDLRVAVLGPRLDIEIPSGGSIRSLVSDRRLTDDPGLEEFPAWSADGSVIVFSNTGAVEADESGFSPTQEVWSVSTSGGTPTQLTDNDVPDTQPDVSVDGRVAFMRDCAIWTMAIDGSDQQLLAVTADGGYFSPRWSPDGTKLALLRYDPSARTAAHPELGMTAGLPLLEVVLLDLATSEIGPLGTRVATDLNAPSWTPDGQALLVNIYDVTARDG